MKIIDKSDTTLKFEDMAKGRVYKITTNDRVEHFIMPIFDGNLDLKITSYEQVVVDLMTDTAFIINDDETIKIEELNAELIIKKS